MENRYTVLIVDDAEYNIELFSEVLSESYDILTATNGSQALEIMRGKSRPDVVLLDLVMPKPDGFDVLEDMNSDENLRSIPVVVVTGETAPSVQSRSYELGAIDFVKRGEDMDTIVLRIKSVIRLCEMNKIRRENERLQREITLERQLGGLMDNLPGGVAMIKIKDQRAECTYFNNKLLNLFHMNSDEFVMQFVKPVPPEWLRIFIENALRENKFGFEFSIGDKTDPQNCQWIRVTVSGIGKNDSSNEMYCVFLDINYEKRQELLAEESGKQLRENQLRLETIINNAPGGICSLELYPNGSNRILFMNRGLFEMLGYSSYEECLADIRKRPNFGMSNNDIAAIRKKISEASENGGRFRYAFKCEDTHGKEMWLSLQCQLIESENSGKTKMYSFITNLTKEKRYELELRNVAFFDPLTGLFNRHAFMKNARKMIDENPLVDYSLMILNIGSFRVVNDLFGRDVGDKVLTSIGDAIRGLFADNGVFGRIFADKFVVLTPYSERGVHPLTLLNTVQKTVSEKGLVSHEMQYYVGVYTITDRNMSVDNMTDRAAIACRSISGSYQEHIAYYDEKMRQTMLDEQELCDDSRRALEKGEFCVYYQPVYGIKAKRFVSAEALVRWIHPVKGMINPGKFIPLFEKNGFIAELDLYVLEQACKFMKRRDDKGLPKFPISVNISRMSLYDINLFDKISALTDSYAIDPKYFRIEITETAYSDNPSQLLETIGMFRSKSYPVLMDDFGSGYSSLNTLKDIPIDILKLDMKFMQGFEKNAKVGTIVTSVARMAKWLNIPMLAEGVETKEQFDFLASIGCAYIQGYYFSRPVPEEEFSKLIALETVKGNITDIEKYTFGEEVNELLGSNALVSKLISGAFGGFGIYEMYDNKLEAIRVNDGYMQIMGYTPEDFNEKRINVWDMMSPEYAEISRKACYEALKTDEAVHAHVLRYDKNGKLLHLDGVHRRLGGTDENPLICIAFNDITEHFESEQLIDRSYTEIEEILKATGSAVSDIDYENNKTFLGGDMSDYDINLASLSEMIDDVPPEAFHPEDYIKAKKFCEKKCAGKHSEEFRIRNKRNGKYYWWKITEVRTLNENGDLARMIGVANNIDSEKRAKLALEQERIHINAVMNKLGAGILMVEVSDDHKAHIIYSNDSFWRTIGQSKPDDDVFFKKIYKGLSDKDKKEINDTVANSGVVNSTYHVTRMNGEKAFLDLTVGLSRIEDGKRVYMILVSDITKQHNDRLKLEAIVRNYHEGLALVNMDFEGKAVITYANDKFYNVLDAKENHTARVISMLEKVIRSGIEATDVHISRGESNRIVRIHVGNIGVTVDCKNYIVSASDVTLARTQSQNRIAERSANAYAGLYDEVFELNYRAKTTKLTYYRRSPERAQSAKTHSLDTMMVDWGKRYVFPDDYDTFKKFIFAPFDNPDFTDAYCEILVCDGNGDGKYHITAMTLVRSHSDTCMLFIRERARRNDSEAQTVIEDTHV